MGLAKRAPGNNLLAAHTGWWNAGAGGARGAGGLGRGGLDTGSGRGEGSKAPGRARARPLMACLCCGRCAPRGGAYCKAG